MLAIARRLKLNSAAWVRGGAVIDIDLVGGRAFAHGVLKHPLALVTSVGSIGDLKGPALDFMQRTAGGYVVEFLHPGGTAVMNTLSTAGANPESLTTSGTTFVYTAGGADQTITLAASATFVTNKLYRFGKTWGAAGCRGSMNGETAVSTASAHAVAGANAKYGISQFADRTGLLIRRMTFWPDLDRISAADLQQRALG